MIGEMVIGEDLGKKKGGISDEKKETDQDLIE